MTEDHGYFEVLCALAASGQLTRSEAAELREHARQCESCRSRITEWNVLGAQLWAAHAWKDPGARLPRGMKQRFVTRAIREGVPLRPRAGHRVSTTRTEQLRLAAIIVLAISMLIIAHKPGAMYSSAIDTGRGGNPSALLSAQADTRASQESLNHLRTGGPDRSPDRNSGPASIVAGDFPSHRASAGSRRGLAVGRRVPGSIADAPATTRTLEAPRFAFTGYPQKSTASALIPPAIAFQVRSRSGVTLLAECTYCALSFSSLPVGRTFVPPPAQTPLALLSFAVSRPPPYFKMDPAAFQLIKSVGP